MYHLTVRNTGLQPWTADNYDLSLEYYFGRGGVASRLGCEEVVRGDPTVPNVALVINAGTRDVNILRTDATGASVFICAARRGPMSTSVS